jgi:entericidin B
MLKRIFATLLMLSICGAIVGCNTIAGAGKDIERGGEAVHDTAKDAQKKM